MEGLTDPPHGIRVQSAQLTQQELDRVPAKYREMYKALHNSKRESMFVAFEGTRAYIRNETGNVMPMPDGIYEIPNTTYKIMIRNGEKVRPNL